MDWFEKISPLILLIVWAILAAAANQKKKKVRSEQAAPTDRQPGKPVQPANQSDNPVETLMEKLRRGLEEISQEVSQSPADVGQNNTGERVERTSPPPLPESTDERVRRAEAQQGEKRKKLRQREKPKYVGTSEYAPIESLTRTGKTTTPVVSDAYTIDAVKKNLPSSDLRKGIIWLEILQPPVSLRD